MTSAVATLSMYDWPETSYAMDRLWDGICAELLDRGIDAPVALNRQEHPVRLWSKPELIIGQTCGWPYANYLREQVVPFARFAYDLHDCEPGNYNSVYIGNSDEDADHLADPQSFDFIEKLAINGDDSQSGFHVFAEITGKPSEESIPKEKRILTGAHRNSVAAVASGEANVAAIDAVAFELAKRYDTEAVSNIVVLGNSRSKPGLPLITSKANAHLVPELTQAVKSAVDNAESSILETLLITGVVDAKEDDYLGFVLN